MVAIVNATRESSLASSAERATSFFTRGRGLMMRPEFPEGSGLVIDPCSSIHMFFMRFPIDVLYLDQDDKVVRVQEGIKPWRIGPLRTKGAKYVIELPAGTVAKSRTSAGDQIVFS